MVNAILYMIAALLMSASAALDFTQGDAFSGGLWVLLAIINGALSIAVAREER
jgi:hypothetical protein